MGCLGTKRRAAACLLLVLALVVQLFSGCAGAAAPQQAPVRIAVPYTPSVRQFSTNYYKEWLEAQTGLSIEFVEIDQTDAEAYLDMAFSTGNSTLDAIFLPGTGEEWLSAEALNAFGRQGHLLPLEGYIDADGENTRSLFESFESYDLRRAVTAANGHIYSLPAIRLGEYAKSQQTLWINFGWLKALGLTVPQTTAELEAVLLAFANGDPNGNGVADELPIVGSAEDATLQATGFLMGSFVYNDIDNAHMLVQNGQVSYAPATDAWREGLRYLVGLHRQGLLPDINFSFTTRQLVQLANDPRDLVGCFATGSITDVLFQNSPEVISRFIHVAPLASPQGKGLAAVSAPQPRAAGAIAAGCQRPEAVFRLMDLMLGQTASRIAWYGEEGVDWRPAGREQISICGGAATIQVLNTLTNKVQNKTLAGLGPGALAAPDADGVTWNGFEVDQEYVDARAHAACLPYHPAEYLPAILFPLEEEDALEGIRAGVEGYTHRMMTAFVTGRANLEDDDQWTAYLDNLDNLGLGLLVAAVQQSCNETPGSNGGNT